MRQPDRHAKTVVLLTPEEMDAARNKTVDYRPPAAERAPSPARFQLVCVREMRRRAPVAQSDRASVFRTVGSSNFSERANSTPLRISLRTHDATSSHPVT